MPHKKFRIPVCFLILLLSLSFSVTLAQKYDAELLNTETTIEVKGTKLIKKHFYAIKINNRAGDQYAEITIPFSKLSPISDLDAYILDFMGAKVKSLKKDDITERSAESESSLYTDHYIKEFSLRNNTYPYTLIYSYQQETSQFYYISGWMPVIDDKVPTLQAKLTLIVPKGYKINFRSNKVEPPKVDSLLNLVTYQWQASYPKVITSETWSPPVEQFQPYVYVVPVHFRYENEGSQDTWLSFGNWVYSMQNGLDELPLSEQYTIHRITDTLKDTKDKIRSLFHYLQSNTRYINVTIKTGGFKPYPASYVAEKKYGDCKALANYFRACLTSIGINSYYTTINAGFVLEDFDTTFPSQQFNHIIVYVPLQNDTLWVDATSDFAFGYLGTFTQNRPALVVMNNNSKLINTPALSYNEVLVNRTINAEVHGNNSLRCEFTGTYRGYLYEQLSKIKSELSETDRKTILARYIVETGFLLEKYSTQSHGRDVPEIGMQYTATTDQFVKSYGNETLLKVIPIELPVLEDPKKRKLPVQLNYPKYYADTINYALPTEYSVSALPANINVESPYGEYNVAFTQNGQWAQVIKRIKIRAGTIVLNDYPLFYTFYNGILESEKSLYITLNQH